MTILSDITKVLKDHWTTYVETVKEESEDFKNNVLHRELNFWYHVHEVATKHVIALENELEGK